MRRSPGKMNGFTLVEVIASSVILCAAVMIVGSIATRALLGTQLSRRYETAASLADKQLGLIDYVGIDSVSELGEMEGDIEEAGDTYHWVIETEYQEINNLYQVKVTVNWVVANRPYSFVVDTMLNGTTVASYDTPVETGQE
ncbi:MAG: prepilin-type N-terminal cleavage/methylation domain-containing protein [Sedimentisphaerales bacterium]|nr:prepilin-type N-terminal cleavage/methylation domain-containing protein [Sedimentisphaerales bacterium]